MKPRRRILPSFGLFIWLVFFVALNLSDWRMVLVGADGDPSLHWRIGDWMIQHRAIVRAEQFSHTRAGAPLITKEWLSEILFAAAGNLLGWNGAVLLAATLIATTLWLLYRLLLREGVEPLLATGLVLLAALASSQHWLARPHLFTHLLTVIFFWQLRAFDHGKIQPSRLYLCLVPLMALWVNLHGAFFTGFVLIGIHWSGVCIEFFKSSDENKPSLRNRLFALGLLAFACLAVTLINPNGWRLHAHIFDFLRTPALAGFANEFASPNFHSDAMRGFLLLLLVLTFLLMFAHPKLTPTEILLIGVWGYFALHSVRNVPLFAILVTPILGEHIGAYLRNAPPNRILNLYRKISSDMVVLSRNAGGGLLAALIVAAVLFAMAKPVVVGGPPVVTTDILASRFPVVAVQFLQHHPEVVRGEMFNDYGWGGYLMLAMPERGVFVDGRNDFYGAELIEEFNEADEARPGWEKIFEKHNVGWTILPFKHPLNRILELHPDWKLVYLDDVTAIYSMQFAQPRRG